MARGSLFKTGKLKPALRECERPLESAEGERLEKFIRGLKQGIRARMGQTKLAKRFALRENFEKPAAKL